MAVRVIAPVSAYRQTASSTARWQEELIWQRALRRLETPPKSKSRRPGKPEDASRDGGKVKRKGVGRLFGLFRSRLGKHLGRHVDFYV